MENVGLFGGIVYVAILILMIVSGWKLYEKAGKPGWAYIIPIYGTLVMLEIIGKPWWWLLLMFVPIVNVVILVWAINLLCKSFGKGVGYTIGLFIPIMNIILFAMLGFGDAKYEGPAGS